MKNVLNSEEPAQVREEAKVKLELERWEKQRKYESEQQQRQCEEQERQREHEIEMQQLILQELEKGELHSLLQQMPRLRGPRHPCCLFSWMAKMTGLCRWESC